MKALNELSDLATEREPIAMAMGVFDGVHKGHGEVLARTVSGAGQLHGKPWVLTFEPHPEQVLNPATAPLMLTSMKHRLRLLERLGIQGCVVIKFTRQLAELPPAEFVERLLGSARMLRQIYVGEDWRFGRGGSGTPAVLAELGRARGVSVTGVPPVAWNGKPISSSRIRDSVLRGDLADAAAMLGRPYSLLGTVVSGHSIGRTLGFPTANLDSHSEVRPPNGVYAVRALLDESEYRGVLYIGLRPTFEPEPVAQPVIELHLPGAKLALYGREVEVLFVRRLRAERKFPSQDGLREQIALDIQQALAPEA